MNTDAHSLIYSAVQKLQSGQFIEAEGVLKSVLALEPGNFDALNILGLLKTTQKNYLEAAPIFKKAYSLNPNDHALSINLGQVLMSLQLFDEAYSLYLGALIHFPNDPDLEFGLANSLHYMGQHDTAISAYEGILRAHPLFLNARINLAALLSDQGQHSRALLLLENVLSEDILAPEYWSNLATIYSCLKMWESAQASAQKALLINPVDPRLHIRLGEILLVLGDSKKAIHLFEAALGLDPNIPEAWIGLGNAYSDEGFIEKALSSLDQALSIDPNNFGAWCAKGMLLKNEGHGEQALNCFAIAHQLDETIAEPIYNSSHVQLQSCNLQEGWSNYDFRWKVRAFNSKWIEIDKPLWNGGAIQGALLVWGEQGIGDQILYASILSLASKQLSNIVALVEQRLLPIFRRSFPEIRFVINIGEINLSEVGAHIPMGSLGKYFLRTLNDFTQRKMPYLIADHNRSDQFKNKIKDANRLICGLAWASKSIKHAQDKSFSLVDLVPVLNSEKMTFVDIGYLESASERANLQANFSIKIEKLLEVDSFNDIDALASLIDACDVIFTCSNTCAHLAGALGKKAYLIVPQSRGRFWYWQDIDGISLWYPSIRVLTRASGQAWSEPINALKRILGS